MRSRISRGFARLGMVLAIPLVLLAAATAAMELKWQSDTVASLDPAAVHHADLTVAAVLVVAALAAYGLPRGLAWVLDGFLVPAHPLKA